ncbi:MAG: DUF1080 domain-containing protein [Verrucomicrobiae bacterium]|nr:DUF1080 domain-containing protein [Verrucomicrobiae bacterium]
MKSIVKTLTVIALFAFLMMCFCSFAQQESEWIPLFDGKTFNGWVGDTNKTWQIKDGAFVGGSTNATVPQNEFLRTTRSFTNFILSLQFKLVGTEGFINAGVQIRSQPLKNPPNEMCGYQCDMGDGWWGCLYDESRRNKVLAKPDPDAVKKAFKKDDWNHYLIRCEGNRIRSYINDVLMIDYTEPESSIEQYGVIGLQIHGGGKAIVSYRDIKIKILP